MEISLLFVVAIAIATGVLLHPVPNEMEAGPLYPSSAPVVKAVPIMCLIPEVSLLCELPQSLLY